MTSTSFSTSEPTPPGPIRRLLVANRGEIALRVMRTCRRLGIETVAIYTEHDAGAPHVRAADDAVEVQSYLGIEEIAEIAYYRGCDAVHPGYGFLSENPAFAREIEAHRNLGIVLVGPTSEVMEQMGRKDRAREIAIAAGVPVVPQGVPTDPASYPVLVKAAAGGGGKGMRVVRSPGELEEATAAAEREALAAFGDDTMLVERYVEHGRHIEVQVLGDTHGTLVHLGERDCSTQRRHQKVLEEAPAPTLDDATRDRIRQAGVDLAASVGYTGVGTVEFLLDADTGEFFFLEMNTRLQVEHPVTEAVVRIAGDSLDLVEQQLLVAAGEPLGFTQGEVTLEGHAIEARVYAEDAFGGFLPQAGTTSLVRWPSGPDIRVDQALEPGQTVSTAYDPMLGKVIARGRDRESARLALRGALDRTSILGLTSNAGFLRALVDGAEFRDATIDTAWLDTATVAAPDPEDARLLVAWVSAMIVAGGGTGPMRYDGFRLGAAPAPTIVELDRRVVVDRVSGTVDGVPVRQLSAQDHVLDVLVDGRRVIGVVNVQPAPGEVLEAAVHGQRFVFVRPDRGVGAAGAMDGTITAPMPGTVLDVRVEVGDVVEEGAVLGVLEAMKMELSLKAPYAGVVGAVAAVAGTQVPIGAILFEIEEGADGA